MDGYEQARQVKMRVAALIEQALGQDSGGLSSAPHIVLDLEPSADGHFSVRVATDEERVWQALPTELDGVVIRLAALGPALPEPDV